MGILCREFRKVVASGEEREREGGRERNVLWARSRDASACSLENLSRDFFFPLKARDAPER